MVAEPAAEVGPEGTIQFVVSARLSESLRERTVSGCRRDDLRMRGCFRRAQATGAATGVAGGRTETAAGSDFQYDGPRHSPCPKPGLPLRCACWCLAELAGVATAPVGCRSKSTSTANFPIAIVENWHSWCPATAPLSLMATTGSFSAILRVLGARLGFHPESRPSTSLIPGLDQPYRRITG